MSKPSPSSAERRSFLNHFHAAAAAIAALAAGRVAKAQEKPAHAAPFEPALHAQDDWMDKIPGKHRIVIDTTSPDGIRDGLLYAGNFVTANRNDYGLQSQDLAIIVVARHQSAGYGFNNEMWAKYGEALAGRTTAPGPPADAPAKESPKTNPSAAALASLSTQGVQFAVCAMSARRLAGMIARSTGATADAAYAELSANLVRNARLVPAGIVSVSRAQERGYTLAKA